MVATSTRLRTSARRALGRALARMPLAWTEQVRTARAEAPDGSARHVALTAAIMLVLRHRPLEDLEVITPADDPDLRLVAADSLLARRLYWLGEEGYEGSEARWWRRCCRDATSILEIGANIGYYTVLGARENPSARFVAVEPHPVAAANLRRNLALNGLDHVEVLEVAVVGEKTADTVELAMPDLDAYEAPTGSYLRDLAEHMDGREASVVISVAAVAMADLIEGVDLIKLDIEGMEATVLGAVHDQLVRLRPMILVEVLPEAVRMRSLVSDLHQEGYVAFAVGETSLHLLSAEVLGRPGPLPDHGGRDVLLVPAERVGTL